MMGIREACSCSMNLMGCVLDSNFSSKVMKNTLNAHVSLISNQNPLIVNSYMSSFY